MITAYKPNNDGRDLGQGSGNPSISSSCAASRFLASQLPVCVAVRKHLLHQHQLELLHVADAAKSADFFCADFCASSPKRDDHMSIGNKG